MKKEAYVSMAAPLKHKVALVVVLLLIIALPVSVLFLQNGISVGKAIADGGEMSSERTPLKIFPLKQNACADLHPEVTTDFYVDNTGRCGPCSDDGSGSVTQPWCTIERAFSASLTPHLEGRGKLYIREGKYRFDSDVFGTELSVYLDLSGTAANPTIISGYPGEKPMIYLSDRVPGWERYAERSDENIWVIDWNTSLKQNHNWQYLYTYKEGTWAPQLVAIDEDPIVLLQEINSKKNGFTYGTDAPYAWADYRFPSGTSSVGTDQMDMDQGTIPTFYYERDATDSDFGKLFIWLPDGTNPNNRNIEVSVSPRMPFSGGSNPIDYLHLKNLAIRFAGAQFATISLSGSYNRFENLDSSYGGFSGLGGICKNCVVKHSVFRFNGNTGADLRGENTVYEGNIIESNNWRKYSRGWSAGGMKLAGGPVTNMIIRKNLFKDNDGYGLWFDGINVENVLIEENVITDNTNDGIFIEASGGTAPKPLRIRSNLLLNNGIAKFGEQELLMFDGGVLLSGARWTLIENNLIYYSPGGITERAVSPEYPLQQNILRDNIFLNVSFPLTIQRGDTAGAIAGDTISDRNVFMNPGPSAYWKKIIREHPTMTGHIARWLERDNTTTFCYGWCFDWEGNGKNFTQWQALGFDQNSQVKAVPGMIDLESYGISLMKPPQSTVGIIAKVREDLLAAGVG